MVNKQLEDMKITLLEEMGKNLSALNSFIDDVLEPTGEITLEKQYINIMSVFTGISHQIGYLTSIFNQFYYISIETDDEEKIKDEGKIGFALKE